MGVCVCVGGGGGGGEVASNSILKHDTFTHKQHKNSIALKYYNYIT